ncbi:NapC/NirT family cytochrome c [Shewanella sp.]|uniref:NapC/NirT family cytochrome c n=1 Tax=Shewanella sp. TaxID=50422 RepID=UPI0040539EAF
MSWRKITKPSSQYSVLLLLVVGIIVGVVGYFTVQQTLHITSSDAFCMTCHSNHSLKEEVLASSHGGSKSGVVVECQQCHLPQEPLNYLIKKIIVSKDVIGFLTIENFNTQAWLEENRKAQADIARDYLRSIDSSTCQNCHKRIYEDQSEAMNNMAVRMHHKNSKKVPPERQTCIDCHKGIVHPYPET